MPARSQLLGRMDRYITLQNRTLSQSTSGEETEVWANLDQVWSARMAVNGREFQEGSQRQHELGYAYEIHHRTDLTAINRVLDGSLVYGIDWVEEDVGGRNRRLRLHTTGRGIADGSNVSGTHQYLASSVFVGQAVDEQIFGYIEILQDGQINGGQIFAQVGPVGSAITVDIINSGGTEQSKVMTLADGATEQSTSFATALAVSAGDKYRLKIKSVGSTTAGSWLTVNLEVQIGT